MNNGIWNKERGPKGETGDTGPTGPAWDGDDPLSKLTITNIADFQTATISLSQPTTVLTTTTTGINFDSVNVEPGFAGTVLRAASAAVTGTLLLLRSGSIDRGKFLSNGRFLLGNSPTDNTVDLLQVGSDTDISASIGRLAIYGLSDIALISHYNFKGLSTAYALLQDSNGKAILNSASGQTTSIRVANVDVATFSGTDISLLETTKIDTTPAVDGNVRYELSIFEDATLATGRGGGIAFGLDTFILGGIKSYTIASSSSNAEMRFQVRNTSTLVDAMVLSKDGELILGSTTSNGTDHLQVTGSGLFTGALTVQGLPTSDPVSAGALWNSSGTVMISAG